uniref:Uncharacterized protein n=1 Tax=Kalanchoe fedtschenkoi TaxID=63787 RepID=A0A7N0VNJ5_KALFE
MEIQWECKVASDLDRHWSAHSFRHLGAFKLIQPSANSAAWCILDSTETCPGPWLRRIYVPLGCCLVIDQVKVNLTKRPSNHPLAQ